MVVYNHVAAAVRGRCACNRVCLDAACHTVHAWTQSNDTGVPGTHVDVLMTAQSDLGMQRHQVL